MLRFVSTHPDTTEVYNDEDYLGEIHPSKDKSRLLFRTCEGIGLGINALQEIIKWMGTNPIVKGNKMETPTWKQLAEFVLNNMTPEQQKQQATVRVLSMDEFFGVNLEITGEDADVLDPNSYYLDVKE